MLHTLYLVHLQWFYLVNIIKNKNDLLALILLKLHTKVKTWLDIETGIFTVDFCNKVHIDQNNHHREERSVSDNDLTGDIVLPNYVKSVYDFVNEFEAPQPTTCCYEFVSKSSESVDNVSIHCYFVMPNVGIAHCLLNHWMNIFLGRVLLHGTSVPVFFRDPRCWSISVCRWSSICSCSCLGRGMIYVMNPIVISLASFK